MDYKHPYFTEEEVEEDKEDILRLRKAGIPYRRIMEQLGRSQSYVKRLEGILIEEGKLSEEEVKIATEKYFKENPASQGINKTKVHKKNDRSKAEKRHKKSIDKKEQVYKLLKKKYSKAQISHELKIIDAVVNEYTNQLINEGRIEKSEIYKSNGTTDKKVKELIDRSSEEYLNTRNSIVEFLKKGFKNFAIRKELNLTSYDVNLYVSDIKIYKIMTSEQIKRARELKKLQDLQFMAEHIKRGYTLTQIRELKPEFSYNETTPLVKILIELGIVTEEEIEQNKRNAIKNTQNRDLELSPKEQRELIIKGVKKGLTPLEIVNSDKTNSLSMHKVLYQKRLIIQEGIISQEEADKAMNKHIEKQLKKRHKQLINDIKKHVEQGYYYNEIADKMHVSLDHIEKLKNDYAEKYGWYSKEEIKQFHKQRILREKAEKVEIEKAKQEESRRIELERKKQEEQEEKRIKNELRKIKLKELRIEARREDKKEIDGEENVSTISRENYLKALEQAVSIGYKPIKEDIDLAFNTITLYPEMANTKNLKVIIMSTFKLNGISETEKLINELYRDLGKTKYANTLQSYRVWIKQIALLPKINKLKDQGFNNQKIAEILRISTHEIKSVMQSEIQGFNDNDER